jgi:hypothetical protein
MLTSQSGDVAMAARVIYIGTNEGFRVSVLRRNGYLVDICESFRAFYSLFVQGPEVDAVVVTDSVPVLTLRFASKLCATTAIAFIRFKGEGAYRYGQEIAYLSQFEFDLTIPPFTAPSHWLHDIERVIEHSRALRSRFAGQVLPVPTAVC